MKFFAKQGMGLVEIVIGASLITLGLVGLLQAYSYYVHVSLSTTPTIQAAYLLEESIEVMKLLRGSSYSGNIAALSISQPTYLSFSSSTNRWSTTTVNTFVDGVFERKITSQLVYRDANQDIATTAQSLTLDVNTRLITATVSWLTSSGTTSKSVSEYITNLYSN